MIAEMSEGPREVPRIDSLRLVTKPPARKIHYEAREKAKMLKSDHSLRDGRSPLSLVTWMVKGSLQGHSSLLNAVLQD